MKLSFHGAAQCVTGSKHLLKLKDGTQILLDCGMFQGHPKEVDEMNRSFGFDPAGIHFLILSHAHIDHCGLIPKLVKDGFRGKIFCTEATFDLARILLLDSAHIQEQDLRYMNKRRARTGKPAFEPLYDEGDVERAFKQFESIECGEWTKLKEGVELLFTDAGHIIGSAVVNLKLNDGGKEICLTFSGDVGRYNDEILRSPETFPQADYIILESTYGDSLHEPGEVSTNALLNEIVHTCLKKKGNLIIPAFSVGRTQEIVYALNRLEIDKKLPQIDVFVDSPLSVEATRVMKKHSECFNQRILDYMKRDPEPFDFKRLHYTSSAEESKALNEREEPCVIISASGMADAGRVKHHIAHNCGARRNTVLLVGYCEPRSLGGRLMRGQREITIFGESHYVQADVKTLRSFSAHGDYEDLCQFLACQNAKEVKQLFLVHGELETQQTFQSKLLRKGFAEVIIPELHQSFDI